MNVFPLFIALVFLVVFIYSTRKIWIEPEAFLEDNRRKRAKYSDIWSKFPFRYVAESLNKHPTFELWYSRIVFLLMYLMISFGLIVSLTDSLR
jgi:hypothetical protein